MDYNTARAKVLGEFQKFQQAEGLYQDELKEQMRAQCISKCFTYYLQCNDAEDLRQELLNLILKGPD